MATGWPMKTTYANGDVYSASDVNDITGTINLLGSSVAYTAGKNKIINGDFSIWQRGTSFTGYSNGTFTADRWSSEFGGTGATRTVSRSTFTPGTAPVSGYEGQYYLTYNRSVAGTSPADYLVYKVEDARTLAGQTATISFWAKANASLNLSDITFYQAFGSGGSATSTTTTSAKTITTSWVRYTTTVSIPSVSGKTIGTGSSLQIYFVLPASGTFTFDIWGVQLEQGSTATAFQTATGTIQGELAACQRYYWRLTPVQNETIYGTAIANATTAAVVQIINPVPMRTIATSVDYTALALLLPSVAFYGASSLAIAAGSSSTNVTGITLSASGLTTSRVYWLANNGGSTGYLGLSAEL